MQSIQGKESFSEDDYEVVVVGAGNAALTGAISAREHGARVLVLEKADSSLRGGNTRFAIGSFRFTYNGIEDLKQLAPDIPEDELETIEVGTYGSEDFLTDIMRVTKGKASFELADILVKESFGTLNWLTHLGVKWELTGAKHAIPRNGKKHYAPGTVLRPKGGGRGFVDMLFSIAQENAIEVRYETTAEKLLIDETGRISGVRIRSKDGYRNVKTRALVLGCGGFEASAEMREKYLGKDWSHVKVRGSRHNVGEGIKMAIEIGAKLAGDWTGCHASPIDAEAPEVESGESANRYSYPYGIMVNTLGRRFTDEGEDFYQYTYAKTGRQIIGQPEATAFQIFDSKVTHLLKPEYSDAKHVVADSIEELGVKLGIPPENLSRTVREFNDAVQDTPFNPTMKDGKCTMTISPPKTNWAQRIDTPPYRAYKVTAGITFTFGGLAINRKAQVINMEEKAIPGLYAAGEIVGGLFHHNYPAATGLMAGAVFGRIAGANAASEK